jgi:hypothetical protein
MLGRMIGIPAFTGVEADNQDRQDSLEVRRAQKKLTASDRAKSRELQGRLLAGEKINEREDSRVGIRQLLMVNIGRLRGLFSGRVIRRSHQSVDNNGISIMGSLPPLVQVIVPVILSKKEEEMVHAHAEVIEKS